MGGDNMKKKRGAGYLRQKQYVIAGTLVILAAIGMTWFYTSQQTRERQEKERQLAQEAEMDREEELAAQENTEEEELQQASSVVLPKETEDIAEVSEQLETTEEDAAEQQDSGQQESEQTSKSTEASGTALHFSLEEGLSWPMEGDVILGFHMDQTVYFATLDQYKYNPAILIAGEVNNKVFAAAQGKITDIAQNEVTGCTVTMDLGDGYTAIYGQLKDLNFGVGDLVEEGQVIGYISEPTKYFSVEGSNLYFEIQKDGVPQDPVALIDS